MSKYFNFDYENNEYYQISYPEHDHYTYDYKTDSWYEVILFDKKEKNNETL